MGFKCVAAIVVASLATVSAFSGQERASALDQIRQAHERALAQPFDDPAFRAYLSTLPRDDDYYVLEGDILATESEVREYLVARAGSESRAGIKPELIVNLIGGQRDYYADPRGRTLTYYVDGAGWSGTEQATVRQAMVRATAAWQDVCPTCGIAFKEAPGPSPVTDAAPGFVVRRVNAQGKYIAAAFFPHDAPARRVLRVDRTFFTSGFDPVGVLRHELGHVLGYRHEHIRGISGCALEGKEWLPLTRYDPHSVMHYMCGGGGSLELNITPVDIAGHRLLYAPRVSGSAGLSRPPVRTTGAAAAQQLLDAVRKDPFDPAKRAAYLRSLPKAGQYYVVEGDLRMTEDEVIEYLAGRGNDGEATQQTPELVVNLHAGKPDFYPPGQRTLTYRVDRQTFPTTAQSDEAVKAVRAATAEWEKLCHDCGVRFVPLDDGAASAPNFTVRYFDAKGEFIASAFFPHDPPARRTIDLDPSFYSTTFDRVGVLRHELGHVMGYRHEHIRNVPGCFSEDSKWKPLTAYDAHSVMHYFCGGGGNLKLEFTEVDRAGHSGLYRLPTQAARPRGGLGMGSIIGSTPAPPPPPVSGVLVVSFEGGNVVDNAASVLEILYKQRSLPIAGHIVSAGETLETIYRAELGLPSFSKRMTDVASLLNRRDLSTAYLKPGERIVHPAVRFTEDTFGVRGDYSTLKKIEETSRKNDQWVQQTKAPRPDEADKTGRVELRRFELRLPMTDDEAIRSARKQINGLDSRNIVVAVDRPPAAKSQLYFSVPQPPQPPPRFYSTPDQFEANSASLKAGEQAAVLSLLGPKEFLIPASCAPLVNCPDIVLVDKPLSVHPDLKDALAGDNLDRAGEDQAMVANGQQVVSIVPWKPEFHATHLAGLIAARDNDFGLVGINPGVRIAGWNWDVLVNQPSEFASRVSRRQANANSRGALQVYVFATGWPVDAYADPEQRVTDDIRALRLVREGALVVAAAGQAEAGRQPERLDARTRLAPMNLGDQENVLVVTACGPCGPVGAKLMADANYSGEFVHVAAPGINVLSTVPGAKYSHGTGTSQATAITAGLASAMVARYRDQLHEAYQVKTRIEVTSTPLEFLGDPKQGAKLAAGVIDPLVATLDPGSDWLKEPSGDWQKITGAEHAEAFKWAEASLKADVIGGQKTIQLDEVWRLIQKGNRWMIYTGSRRGPVQKIGPATFSPTEQAKVLFRLNGKAMKLANVEDLLLRFPSSGQ